MWLVNLRPQGGFQQAPRLLNIANNFSDQLQIIQNDWNTNSGAKIDHIDLVGAWEEWFPDLLRFIAEKAQRYMYKWLDELDHAYEPAAEKGDAAAEEIVELVATYRIFVNTFHIPHPGFP
jgi:hypothetical protein